MQYATTFLLTFCTLTLVDNRQTPTYSKCAQLIALPHFAALENKVSNIAFATNKMSDTVPDNNLLTHRLWQHCQRYGDLLAISNKSHIIKYTGCGYFRAQTINLYDSMCRKYSIHYGNSLPSTRQIDESFSALYHEKKFLIVSHQMVRVSMRIHIV